MNTFLRAVAMVSASLVMAACGGAMTPEEAAMMEKDALAESEAELGSCANWSEWYPTGQTSCEYRGCGSYLTCDEVPYVKAPDEDTSDVRAEEPPVQGMLYCPDGSPAYRVYRPGTFSQTYSYRVCFDQYGNYTHTEYQYSSALQACGC